MSWWIENEKKKFEIVTSIKMNWIFEMINHFNGQSQLKVVEVISFRVCELLS